MDSLAKVVLTCVPEPGGEAMEAAVARARGRDPSWAWRLPVMWTTTTQPASWWAGAKLLGPMSSLCEIVRTTHPLEPGGGGNVRTAKPYARDRNVGTAVCRAHHRRGGYHHLRASLRTRLPERTPAGAAHFFRASWGPQNLIIPRGVEHGGGGDRADRFVSDHGVDGSGCAGFLARADSCTGRCVSV